MCSEADHALQKKETQSVSNMLPKEAVSSLPDHAKRIQDLDRHFEQALRVLKDATAKSLSPQQTPQAPEQPADVLPKVCPTLRQLQHTSFSCFTARSDGSATQASHVPLPTSLFASRTFRSRI